MLNISKEEQPCHVCEHLGEKECRYTSHKKYRNQKGNQSFKVDIISHSPLRDESSYLTSLKQQKIQFQFPSLIPPFSGYLIGIKQPDESKLFERTLIEKVLEQKDTDKKNGKFQTKGKQQMSEIKEFRVDQKGRIQSKKPKSFLSHHNLSQPKQSEQNSKQKNILLSKIINKVELNPKEKEIKQTQINKYYQSNFTHTNNFDSKANKYHFDYSIKQCLEVTKDERKKSIIKSNESSFHVDESKFNNDADDFFVSRVNEKEKPNFYVGNVFKDSSQLIQIQKNEKLEDQKFDNQKFQQNLNKGILSRQIGLNNVKIQHKKQDSQIEINKLNKNVNNSFPENPIQIRRQTNQFNFATSKPAYLQKVDSHIFGPTKQLLSNHLDFPESRIKQQIPVRIQPNESIQTRRSNFENSRFQHTHFYPIYPVYEVVYELVKVIPDSVEVNNSCSLKTSSLSNPLK